MATMSSSSTADVLDLQADFLETQSSLVQDLANDIHQAASVLAYKTYDLDAEATSLRKEAWQARRSAEEMKTTIKREGGQAKNGRQMSDLLITASQTMDLAQDVKRTLQALIKVVCGSEAAVSSWHLYSNNSALTPGPYKQPDDEEKQVRDTDTDTDNHKLELDLERHATDGSNRLSRKVTRISALGSVAKPSSNSSVAHIAGTETGTRSFTRGRFADLNRNKIKNRNSFVAVSHIWGSDICHDNQIGSDGHGHSHSHGPEIRKNHSLISRQLETKPKPKPKPEPELWAKAKAKEMRGPSCSLVSGSRDRLPATTVCLDPACQENKEGEEHQAALFKNMVVCKCEKCASDDESECFDRPETDVTGDCDGYRLGIGEQLADQRDLVLDEDDTEDHSEIEAGDGGETEAETEAEEEGEEPCNGESDCENDGDRDRDPYRHDSDFLSWIPDKVTISRHHVILAAESLYQSVLMGEQDRLMRERVGG
ncbi:hypothetical protein ABEF95_003772 [Exophiala dermatitidis]